MKDLDELVRTVNRLNTDARIVILRGRFSTGKRRHRRGELAEMEGTPAPYYGDPTGEDAIFEEMADRTSKTIEALCTDLARCLVTAQGLLNLNGNVVERARQSIPDCLACGEPCFGRVLAGFCEACYKRFQRLGPGRDRGQFVRERQAEARAKREQVSTKEETPADQVK